MYETWTTHGYGIQTNEIQTTLEKVLELVSKAPKFQEEVNEYIEEYDVDNIDSLLDMDDEWHNGLAYFLKETISETENIELEACEDFEGDTFLLLTPGYPWSKISEKERNLTLERMNEIFKKYVKILTDEEIDIDYFSVSNGG